MFGTSGGGRSSQQPAASSSRLPANRTQIPTPLPSFAPRWWGHGFRIRLHHFPQFGCLGRPGSEHRSLPPTVCTNKESIHGVAETSYAATFYFFSGLFLRSRVSFPADVYPPWPCPRWPADGRADKKPWSPPDVLWIPRYTMEARYVSVRIVARQMVVKDVVSPWGL
ncbi:hypothetical protein CH063_07858 [Colletotrichum higginsianum]|uniref:Uncharacterized protein n=1 Tax=Colletotrichum higginsianum (strain IMI 349063) TaxID=759273 RepID=H1V7P2_COLHI|nr:hypothetical protein CH063_07858 [Colletotrichum higginsianum]